MRRFIYAAAMLAVLITMSAIALSVSAAEARNYGPIGDRLTWRVPPTFYVKVPPRSAANVVDCATELDIYIRSQHLEGSRTKADLTIGKHSRIRRGWYRLTEDGTDRSNPFGYRSWQRRPFGKELASFDPNPHDNDWDDLKPGPVVFSASRTIYVYGWGC